MTIRQTIYRNGNVTTSINHDLHIIEWSPHAGTTISDWEKSLEAGLDACQRFKYNCWLNDVTDFTCFESEEQYRFVAEGVSDYIKNLNSFLNIAFIESHYGTGRAANMAYRNHVNRWYSNYFKIEILQTKETAIQWLLIQQALNNDLQTKHLMC